MNWYVDVLKKYAVFSGRARRQEYWMFALFNIIATIVLAIVGRVIGFPALVAIYSLAVLLPGLGVAVRRLHDTGRSGWAILIGIIPLVGSIILLVWLASDGKPEDNQYGANPKHAAAV
ncbi:uncharacterized membrane protein YhaH (DUF805 family) [Streptomyces sp. Ag109_O5-1]|uniref:DUF805 domain-containing protein n=1 Tax=Streptomyces TaxID=1883 RepID=UPI000F4D59FD|nr:MULTISPECIES: DUF805 domain-containing protein [Streptomyces]RPE43966.1 uncharacterized membrane protein YhaH (DUF805 family) [Streptomyces sp. Ag109_O5-1]